MGLASLLSPVRAFTLDSILSILRQIPGNRLIQSENRNHDGVPVYVMMPLDFALENSWLQGESLENALKHLIAAGVSGIMVDVWWGLCESKPGEYQFTKYVQLAELCVALGLKMQATMCFHACGGNVGDSVNIPLPGWVIRATDEKQAWFIDRTQFLTNEDKLSCDVNREYISFGADNEPYLPAKLNNNELNVLEEQIEIIKPGNSVSLPPALSATAVQETATSENFDDSSISKAASPLSLDGNTQVGNDTPSITTESSAVFRNFAPSLSLGLIDINEETDASGVSVKSPHVVRITSPKSELAQSIVEKEMEQTQRETEPEAATQPELGSTQEELRTPLDCYRDFIAAFCNEMVGFIDDGTIVELQVGMGPCGELRYPSYPLGSGKWKFPGIGEFQCYDKHLMSSLKQAAKNHSRTWATPPDGAGTYNDTPWKTQFFSTDYRSAYGEFFQEWYSTVLLEHGNAVLSSAREVAPAGMPLAVKVSGVHWWYFTRSRAAEATTGYYMSRKHDFYNRIVSMLSKYDAILDFTCLEMKTIDQPWRTARCGPRQLVRDVFRRAAREGVSVAGENALECYDKASYAQIVNAYKWTNARAHGFTLLRLTPALLELQHLHNLTWLCSQLREVRPRSS